MISTQWRAITSLAIVFSLFTPALPSIATPSLPSALQTVGDSNQVVLVQAPDWKSTKGTLRAFERANGRWTEVVPEVSADLGYGGLVPGQQRVQGTGKTPTGIYAITSSFGRKADPGTKLDYIRVDRNDAWTYNPKFPDTYNIFQSANRSWSSYGNYVERLYSYGKQYNYVAILDYNLPPGAITQGAQGINRTSEFANTRMGGGIFLHVSNGKRTAGCIAIRESSMKEIMNWVDPQKNPVIVIEVI
jgi:L,D-peptidoglycan transpeptidase YkuD (ErfK/YbiS/YcfS/YnhG family)